MVRASKTIKNPSTVESLREEVVRLQQELQSREERLDVLNKITQNINSSLDIDDLLQNIFVEIKKIVHFDMMVVLLLDETGENLKLFTLRKERELPRLEKGYIISKRDTVSGWVVDHHRPRIGRDLLAMKEHLFDEELGVLEGMRSYLMVPLISKDRTIGTLDIGSYQPEAYGEEQARILQHLAGQVAVAIENAQLYGQLRENKLFLENLIESSIDAIVATNQEGIITFASKGVERIIGYRPEEMIGRPSSQFYAGEEVGGQILRELAKGKKILDLETEVVAKDGSLVYISLSASLLYNEGGEVVGTLRVAKDISRRKRLEQQIMQSERLAAAGKLAAGIAHEINNPIAVILSRIDCLHSEASQKGLSVGLLQDLQVIKHHAQNILRITNTLLAFTRESFKPKDSFLTFRPVEINELLEKTALLLRHSLQQKELKLQFKSDPSLPPVWGDENALQQVFINLLSNALDATPPGGKITLAGRRRSLRTVHGVQVQVSDTGAGIPSEHLNRIFDLFFTTKEVGKGTGLGLSICHEIVKNHGGTIEVKSRWGKGATFVVTLPMASPCL